MASGTVLLAAQAFAFTDLPWAFILMPFVLVIVEAFVGIVSSLGAGVVGLIALWKRRSP